MPEPNNPQCTQPHTQKLGQPKEESMVRNEKAETFELAQELPSNKLLTGSGGDEVESVLYGNQTNII